MPNIQTNDINFSKQKWKIIKKMKKNETNYLHAIKNVSGTIFSLK